jgi:signal transduction histidine kinase
MKSFFFVLRFAARWGALAVALVVFLHEGMRIRSDLVPGLVIPLTLVYALVTAFSHVRRVQLIANDIDLEKLSSRHRRQVEIPLPADEAFDIVEAAIRDLPHVLTIESARDSLQVRARVRRQDPYTWGRTTFREAVDTVAGRVGAPVDKPKWHKLDKLKELEQLSPGHRKVNQVLAFVKPGEGSCSLVLICQPEGGALVDWFAVDHGTNLENTDAITRAITRRIAERRKGEEAAVRETRSDKELAVAKLSLLHAQVEPHFLYNTLASAQILTRSDPVRADQMLGHLITYLRNSLPRTEESFSTLGEELERARAYLEILRIRMGDRLGLQIQVPESLKGAPLPPMMLQTLVENAIKHGLEPVPGGGTVWILARESDGKLAVTVADDGRGFSEEGGGTGIGLRNVRERLRLAYADKASFQIVANFPRGVAATITVPMQVAHA